ncbi:MAG: radical SAM protein [Eggerthellaceae bacterium]|nr:radical SAM protein [Eggerthellaceae bacterium]
MDYEGQICRAPMERASFMLPVMVGCSYNRCKFCNLFRHLEYRVLPFEQVEAELKRVRDVGGNPKTVFLGDGNAFVLPMDHLMHLLDMVHEYFPGCTTINMDATVPSIRAKSDEDLRQLADAGVKHLYLGVESGLDDVLHFMNKDHDNIELREQVTRIQQVGMCFDAHIMTGVAGAGRGEENAHAMAALLNETHPAHIVNFSMFISQEVPLWKDYESGAFVPATELDNLKEERILVSELYVDAPEGLSLRYEGFHDFIREHVWGTLPKDREKMLAKLDALVEKYEAKEPIYSMVYGECPKLYTFDGLEIFSMTA